MTYEKPQAVRMTPAIDSIQYRLGKIYGTVIDMILILWKLTAIAYEADE